MTSRWLIVLALATSTVEADPRDMTRKPRVGLLAEIDFATGSSRLDGVSTSQLGRVAAWAYDNFDGLIVLDGHADRDGNIRLSWRRALLVRDQLVALGVDPEQIVVSAFGPEHRRERARVAVWGTRNSAESMIAARRNANMLMWGRHMVPRVRSGPTTRPRRSQAR